ncbi:hypothetical protein N0V83_009394 [Neocucurbitaria cava]|uniref:FAD-binding domain-containing protein n=1 Tax=Neocucurbitaria cava TaxID=798079 RepID=A0A9W8Y212_9PLEO|nr:hypothetical protein N0V83_009394 [Neocucurbitaria cava]
MSAAPQRVIIVGGGPTGMTAAHALTRAGIDFVLLEGRHEIALDAGCNLVLSSMGMRALGQLGLLPALKKVSSPVTKFQRLDHKGRDIGDTMFFTYIQQSHGYYPRVFSRYNLMQVFYDNLPAEVRSKTLANKKVSDIRSTEHGVVVECADGTSYEGCMVIGADGAYSVVRKYMRELALKDEQRANTEAFVNEEKPFLTTYRCFWIRFPVLPGLKVGDAFETHGPNMATQFFVGEDSAVVGIYERLDEPTRDPRRCTVVDEKPFVEKWGNLPLTKGTTLTIAEAYAQKMDAGFINLEEGVVKHWSWGGRMVLAGDAAHKFTPSTGAGCNEGIIDIVVLANHLRRAFSSGAPSPDKLNAAFKEYQDARYELATFGCKLAGNTTAAATWPNAIYKFLDLRVFSSKMIQKFFINQGVATTAQTPVFDYIEGEEEIVGKVPWVHAIPSRTQIV